jgi:hypothetical protein
MKKIQYLIIIGIFLMVSGMVASAYAFDDGSVANNISIFKKQPNNHDGGSDVEPGEPQDPDDQGDPGTVEDPADDDPAGEDASVDIRPNTINLKRHGIFTAIIKLPETIDAGSIDTESIILFVDPTVAQIPGKDDTAEDDSEIAALAPPAIASFTPMTTVAPIRVIVDTFMTNSVIAKFSNQDILGLLEKDIPDIQVPAMVTFWVQWQLTSDTDNTGYQASDEVRVINPGKGNKGKSKGKGKGKGGGAE